MEKVAELALQTLAVEDPSALGVVRILQADYRLASREVDPSSLTDIPLPNCLEDAASTGLILSNKLPNWIAAYVALQCQPFGWIACENPIFSKDTVESVGAAVIAISTNPKTLPGTTIVWRDGVVRRTSNVDPPEKTPAVQIYTIVEAGDDLMVNVEHPKFLDPAYMTQAVLPFVDGDKESKLGISITNARPVFLNVYVAWLASQNAGFRYVAIFNTRTVSKQLGQLGSIVVFSRDQKYPIGTHLDNRRYSPYGRGVKPDEVDTSQVFAGLAIAIIGLPNSGKSVLLRSLFDLTLELPNVFSQEANPDGQGNYFQHVSNPEYYARIREKWEFKKELAEGYYRHIMALREQLNLLWVGLGGKPTEDSTRTLEACTHAVLLTRADQAEPDTELINQWREICDRAKVPIVAQFESSLTAENSHVDQRNAQAIGPLTGVAAKLLRGDPESIERCKPIAQALVTELLQHFPENTPDKIVARFSQWSAG